MLVGIHTDYTGSLDMISTKFEKILKFNNIPVLRRNSSDKDFWETIPKLDLFIYLWHHFDVYRYRAQTILPVIQNFYKIKCFPDQNTCWHYDDKIKQFFMLKSKGYPVVNSLVFWDKSPAMEWIRKEAQYPFVFKLTGGAGSTNVVMIRSKKEALHLAKKMFNKGILPHKVPVSGNLVYTDFSLKSYIKDHIRPYYNKYFLKIEPNKNWNRHKNYFYLQEFLPGNEYDTRVTTIGNRTFAFRRFVRKNDFRASGSNNWSLDRDKIDMRMVKIAQEISKAYNFQVMAYDFIYDKDKNPVIVEISYTYGDYPEFSTGYIDENMQWVDGSFWTQYLELIDALNMPDLKQPDIQPEGHYAEVLKHTK
jgi:glutathione synthase/RimK-type ligase-like ATP-grasp enzyme